MKLKRLSMEYSTIRTGIISRRRTRKMITVSKNTRSSLCIWKRYRNAPTNRPKKCVEKLKNDYRLNEKVGKNISMNYYVPTYFNLYNESIHEENMFDSAVKGGKLS